MAAGVVPHDENLNWPIGGFRWTGIKWVAVSPPAVGHEIGTTATLVPGASHTYVESAYTGKFGGPYHPAVYVTGPLP